MSGRTAAGPASGGTAVTASADANLVPPLGRPADLGQLKAACGLLLNTLEPTTAEQMPAVGSGFVALLQAPGTPLEVARRADATFCEIRGQQLRQGGWRLYLRSSTLQQCFKLELRHGAIMPLLASPNMKWNQDDLLERVQLVRLNGITSVTKKGEPVWRVNFSRAKTEPAGTTYVPATQLGTSILGLAMRLVRGPQLQGGEDDAAALPAPGAGDAGTGRGAPPHAEQSQAHAASSSQGQPQGSDGGEQARTKRQRRQQTQPPRPMEPNQGNEDATEVAEAGDAGDAAEAADEAQAAASQQELPVPDPFSAVDDMPLEDLLAGLGSDGEHGGLDEGMGWDAADACVASNALQHLSLMEHDAPGNAGPAPVEAAAPSVARVTLSASVCAALGAMAMLPPPISPAAAAAGAGGGQQQHEDTEGLPTLPTPQVQAPAAVRARPSGGPAAALQEAARHARLKRQQQALNMPTTSRPPAGSQQPTASAAAAAAAAAPTTTPAMPGHAVMLAQAVERLAAAQQEQGTSSSLPLESGEEEAAAAGSVEEDVHSEAGTEPRSVLGLAACLSVPTASASPSTRTTLGSICSDTASERSLQVAGAGTGAVQQSRDSSALLQEEEEEEESHLALWGERCTALHAAADEGSMAALRRYVAEHAGPGAKHATQALLEVVATSQQPLQKQQAGLLLAWMCTHPPGCYLADEAAVLGAVQQLYSKAAAKAHLQVQLPAGMCLVRLAAGGCVPELSGGLAPEQWRLLLIQAAAHVQNHRALLQKQQPRLTLEDARGVQGDEQGGLLHGEQLHALQLQQLPELGLEVEVELAMCDRAQGVLVEAMRACGVSVAT